MADELLRARCKSLQRSLNDAINGIIEILPNDWSITIILRPDDSEWWLEDPEGNDVSSQWCGDSQDVYGFLSHAIAEGEQDGC